mmetsp:Transcript_2429/g.6198  ORF Transcript_2429/g.6198 Transcript_2429/m.6198 type:complete len:201 (-) Transcript_2429:305-907(-)
MRERVLLGISHHLLDRQHVHAVRLDAGDVVAARVEGGRLGGAPLRGAHAIVVVLAHEDDGQVPQARHVERLVLLALVGRAITVHGHAHLRLLLVAVGKRNARAQGDLCAHDAVAAVKVVGAAVHVHGAAQALGGAGGAPEQLRHDLGHRTAARQHVAVVAVRRDDRVLLVECGLDATQHCLLPIIQVAEATDELRLVLHV